MSNVSQKNRFTKQEFVEMLVYILTDLRLDVTFANKSKFYFFEFNRKSLKNGKPNYRA